MDKLCQFSESGRLRGWIGKPDRTDSFQFRKYDREGDIPCYSHRIWLSTWDISECGSDGQSETGGDQPGQKFTDLFGIGYQYPTSIECDGIDLYLDKLCQFSESGRLFKRNRVSDQPNNYKFRLYY